MPPVQGKLVGGKPEFPDLSVAVADNVCGLIGNTPMVYLNKVTAGCKAKVAAKLESREPSCSVKDRIGYNMIAEAEARGDITPGESTLVEPTSGNTGIAIAMTAAAKGYKCILTMPATMSLERRAVLLAFGAEVILTDPTMGVSGAIRMAEHIVATRPGAVMLQQFENLDNPDIHLRTTGPEFLQQVGKASLGAVVLGVGTGGTLTGIARYLKEAAPDVKVFAVEPAEAAILSGVTPPAPHKIQGIGAGFVPGVLETELITEIIMVKSDDAIKMAQDLAKQEGLLVGISSGAAAAAAVQVAKRDDMEGKTVATLFPSFGERYLSTALFTDVFKAASEMTFTPLPSA